MDMHRLEVFCKVVELGSFTRAAEALPLSQPTVSEHIKTLEEMLEEKLLDRLGREVAPTAAGKILYRYALDILQLRDEAIQAIKKYRGDLSGHLLLGASTIPGTYILPKYVGAFKEKHPSIQISIRIASSGDIVEGVLAGTSEAGLIGARWNDRRIVLEEIFSDELVTAVFSGHPWAGRGSVAPDELYEQPFIMRERGSGTRIVMAQILKDHGVDPSRLRVVAEMGSTEAVRQAIKARIGISIISRHAVSEDLDRSSLAAVPIQDIQFLRPFYLIRRKNRQMSPLCISFLDYLRDEKP